MKAQCDGTIVTGLLAGDAGPDLPEVPAALRALPAARLRLVGGVVVDGAGVSTFFVDDSGRLQAAQLDPAWPGFTCLWSDRAVRDAGNWRIESAGEALARLKDRLCRDLDGDAERMRLRDVTAGSAQAVVYVMKEDEARRFKAAEKPDAADYPMLLASVGVEADTVAGVADLVAAAAARWRVTAAAIEAVRLRAKQAIGAASTAEAARAARAAVAWPSA